MLFKFFFSNSSFQFCFYEIRIRILFCSSNSAFKRDSNFTSISISANFYQILTLKKNNLIQISKFWNFQISKFRKIWKLIEKFILKRNFLSFWSKMLENYWFFLFSFHFQVNFRNAKTKEPTWLLLVQVEPQPHVTHQVFRFYHPENSFFSKFICANPNGIFNFPQIQSIFRKN